MYKNQMPEYNVKNSKSIDIAKNTIEKTMKDYI